MSNPPRDPTAFVEAWLETERLLGVSHYATPSAVMRPAARPSAPATGEAPRAAATPSPRAPARPPTAVQAPAPAAPIVASAAMRDLSALPPMCTVALPVAEAQAYMAALDTAHVRGCRACRLCEQRTQTVFGVGHVRPELVFVGEGPGADEDAQGEPFVGKAGQLLTRMIAAMSLTREQVYICNVVKCRPPGNRTPSDDEMEACSPYLWRQLSVLRPKVIVALGRAATQTLLVTKEAMSRVRGKMHAFPPAALGHLGLPAAQLMPTYHPAYLLRNPPAKAEVWSDLQQVMSFLGLQRPPGR